MQTKVIEADQNRTDSHHSQLFNVPLLFTNDLDSAESMGTPDRQENTKSSDPRLSLEQEFRNAQRVLELQARQDRTASNLMTEKERAEFGEDLLQSDRMLLHQIHAEDHVHSSTLNLSPAANLATLLYSNIFLREQSLFAPQTRSLCEQLKTALTIPSFPLMSNTVEESTHPNENGADKCRALVLPLLMGAFCSVPGSMIRTWFLDQLWNTLEETYSEKLPLWEEICSVIGDCDNGGRSIRGPQARALLDLQRYYIS
ncbi:MAG: hypothetical protein Q9160_007509 [Pyrenula sp. 1 TL-2023]